MNDVFDGDPPEAETEDHPLKGHNRTGGIAADQLKALIERVERLEEEKKTIAEDIREVYAEGKAVGFDTKAMREMVRLRKLDRAELLERESIRDLYGHALGVFG